MPENDTLFRLGLSLLGAAVFGVFGLIAGAVWSLAVGADVAVLAALTGALAATWGAICVQLTPTGAHVMANKLAVNYAVIALHGWLAFVASLIGLLVWGVRSLLS